MYRVSYDIGWYEDIIWYNFQNKNVEILVDPKLMYIDSRDMISKLQK